MLLTSGQISMGISSAIVFIFSTILFLSGYVLQQRTVRDIQAIIRPPPDPTSAPVENPKALVSLDKKWDQVAHVQLLQRHDDACNAIIILAELARQKSLAKRVLLYPREWDREINSGQSRDRSRERSVRLLRRATVRYDVSLRPVDIPFPEIRDGGRAHALASLLSLTEFEAILYLEPSGVVVDAPVLDRLLIDRKKHAAGPSAVHFVGRSMEIGTPLGVMMSPSTEAHRQAVRSSSSSMSITQWTAAVGSVPDLSRTFLASSSLRSHGFTNYAVETRNALNSVGYVKFTDPEILGPQYDIPSQTWLNTQPTEEDTRRIWESFYDQYRGQRMGVCGLDLEPLPLPQAELASEITD